MWQTTFENNLKLNLSISLQNKEQQHFCGIFTHTHVFIAPNLVYFHNSDIGIGNGTSVLLHLSHFSSLCDAHLWSKAQKNG